MTSTLSIDIPPPPPPLPLPDEETGHSDKVMTQQQQQPIEINDEITKSEHTIISLVQEEHNNNDNKNEFEHDGDRSSVSSIKQDLSALTTTKDDTSHDEKEQDDNKLETKNSNSSNEDHQDFLIHDGSASVSSFFNRMKAIVLKTSTTFTSSSSSLSIDANLSKKQSDVGSSLCGDPNNVHNDDDHLTENDPESNHDDNKNQYMPVVDEITIFVNEPPTPIIANKNQNESTTTTTSFSKGNNRTLSDLSEKEKKEDKFKAEEEEEEELDIGKYEEESYFTESTLPTMASNGSSSFENSLSQQEDNACGPGMISPPKLSLSPSKKSPRRKPSSLSPKKKHKMLDSAFTFGDLGNSALGERLREHISGFPFGQRWTYITIALALTSLTFSFLCKHSTRFVTLEKPMLLSATFEPITEVGLYYINLCLAQTIVNKDLQLGVETVVKNSWITPDGKESFNLGDFAREYAVYTGETLSPSSIHQMIFYDDPICATASLNSEMVDDLMWNLARTFVGWTTVYGILMTAIVFCVAFWSSVSLNNISVCLMMLYFFQCLVFFFFDCKICQRHTCTLSSGGIYALIATFSWFLCGMSCVRLLFLERDRARAERRKRRELRRQQRASSNLSPTKSVRSTYSELRSNPSSPIKLSAAPSEAGQSTNIISPSRSITSTSHHII